MIGLLMLAAVHSFMTGNELYTVCTSDTAGDQGYCMGYISGGYDADALLQAAGGKRMICPPEGVTRDQARDVVVKDLRDHPESRQQPGGLKVLSALSRAFPCPK
jgi:hypothetical protein